MKVIKANKQIEGNVIRQCSIGLLLLALCYLLIGAESHKVYCFVGIGLSFALYWFAREMDRVPAIAFTFAKDHFVFHHKSGDLRVAYENIVRVDVVSITQGLERRQIGYIGIKLRAPELMYEEIPLRLASRLLIEQKDLQVRAGKEQCSTGRCDIDTIVDQVEWRSKSGLIMTGVAGMFANRSEVLNRQLGFHFYISEQAFDMQSVKAVQIIREQAQKVW